MGSRYGLRGTQVGEASHPGPATGPTRLDTSSDEEPVSQLCRLHPPPSAHVDVVDMTVADTDSSDSGQPLRNRENDFQPPCRRRTARRVRSSGSEDVPQVRQNSFAVLTRESAENMQARIGGDEEVNANYAPELPEVIIVPQSVPARPARLQLLKRMSQATTEVAPSGGEHDVQQEASRRHGTWVEMTVEDSDNDDEERDNPVESDDDPDCVLDALQRDLEVDVSSVCPAAADAPHFGRVAVQATQRQGSESVAKRPRLFVSPTQRTTQLDGESAIASRSSAIATVEDTPNMSQSLLQHEIPVGPPVVRNPAENDSESDSTEHARSSTPKAIGPAAENQWCGCGSGESRVHCKSGRAESRRCTTETRFESRSSKS